MSRARDRRKHHERIARWSELQPRPLGSLEDLIAPAKLSDWQAHILTQAMRATRDDFVLAYPRGRGA